MKNHNLKIGTYYVHQFNRFSLTIPGAAAIACSQPGVDAADFLPFHVPRIKRINPVSPYGLDCATKEKIADELKEYGAWDAKELLNEEENWNRIVWVACCALREAEEVCVG